MKLYTAILCFLFSFWLSAQNESAGFFSRLESNASILHKDSLAQGEEMIKSFVSSIIETNGE